jgi:hypothetical protein
MNNSGFQQSCFAFFDEDAKIHLTSPTSGRFREHMLALSGEYAKTLVTHLQEAFRDRFDSFEEANRCFESLKEVMARNIRMAVASVVLDDFELFAEERDGFDSRFAFLPGWRMHLWTSSPGTDSASRGPEGHRGGRGPAAPAPGAFAEDREFEPTWRMELKSR